MQRGADNVVCPGRQSASWVLLAIGQVQVRSDEKRANSDRVVYYTYAAMVSRLLPSVHHSRLDSSLQLTNRVANARRTDCATFRASTGLVAVDGRLNCYTASANGYPVLLRTRPPRASDRGINRCSAQLVNFAVDGRTDRSTKLRVTSDGLTSGWT